MDDGKNTVSSLLPPNNHMKQLIMLSHSTELEWLSQNCTAICGRAGQFPGPTGCTTLLNYNSFLSNSINDYFIVAQQFELFIHYICSTLSILNYTPDLYNLVNFSNYPAHSTVTPKCLSLIKFLPGAGLYKNQCIILSTELSLIVTR